MVCKKENSHFTLIRNKRGIDNSYLEDSMAYQGKVTEESSYLFTIDMLDSIAGSNVWEKLRCVCERRNPRIRKESADLKTGVPVIQKHLIMVMYLVHMYIWSFYYFIVYGEKTYGLDSFIVTSVLACGVSFIYVCFFLNKGFFCIIK